MPCYAIEGVTPVVDPTAYVHPTAVLIGDVVVGARCWVGPHASLRGDFGRIRLEEGSNVQDGCVLHGIPQGETRIGVDGHIGHGAVLHGCTIEAGALVGMNAVVMDDAVIGAQAMVAACAFVRGGMRLAPRWLAAGVPARPLRELSEAEIANKAEGTALYQDLTRRCLASLVEVQPLPALDTDRPALQVAREWRRGRGGQQTEAGAPE